MFWTSVVQVDVEQINKKRTDRVELNEKKLATVRNVHFRKRRLKSHSERIFKPNNRTITLACDFCFFQ